MILTELDSTVVEVDPIPKKSFKSILQVCSGCAMLHGIVLELTALTRRRSSVLAFLTNHDARKSRHLQCTQYCLDRTRSFKIPFPTSLLSPVNRHHVSHVQDPRNSSKKAEKRSNTSDYLPFVGNIPSTTTPVIEAECSPLASDIEDEFVGFSESAMEFGRISSPTIRRANRLCPRTFH